MSVYNAIPEFMDVCPTELELSEIKDEYECPQENCNSIFKKISNLKMHLVKHHRIGKLGVISRSTTARYFCPVEQCMYYIHSPKQRSFTENRLLKQHYMKVHGQKRFECEKCQSKFSIQSIYKRHLNSCGIIHVCEVCRWEYNTRDALLIHLLRKHPAVHKLYKQNKTLLEHSHSTSVRNLSNFIICENRDDSCNLFLKSELSKNTSLAIIDDSKYDIPVDESCNLIFKEAVDKIAIKTETGSPNICIKSPNLNRVNVDHLSTKHEAFDSFVINHSVPDDDNMYSIAVTDLNKKPTKVVYVPRYVLVSAATRFQKIAPREPLLNDNVTVETQTSPLKTKKVKKPVIKKSTVKENKRKQSKYKQTAVKKLNCVADEANASSSNQDRCTQTTLKIVKKTNVSETKKFNAETQTFTSTGALVKPKIKLDKSTNMSFESGKRTFATQTNTTTEDDCVTKVFENIKVSEKSMDNTKNDEKTNIIIKIDESKDCSSETTDYHEHNIEFLNTGIDGKQFCIDLNIVLQHATKDKHITDKNQNAADSIFQPCLNEMNEACDDKSNNCFSDIHTESNTQLNFDPSDINSQYAYRGLIDEKCTGTSATIETQTALDELLYSNSWKHDSILFSELICLSDIQTQTAWPTGSINLESFDNCLNTEMESLNDPVKYPDCENTLISTETQTNENIFGFQSKISSFEDTRNESPDFSFKETQTCECFMESINFSDYDFGNLASSSFATSNTHAKNCCRVLLSRRSDVLLSCASSETQTYLKDQSSNKNLTSDSP